MTPEEKRLLEEINDRLYWGNYAKWLMVFLLFCIWALSVTSCTSTNPKTIEKERYEKKYYTPK